ncbi:MAG: recombinase family protein [Clostridiales bacterium]|jgi:DNA invertase Pin-like site-specific DNA recombinase|nr:recombinase family protein [Clostridiales bacterium]
MYGYDIKKGRVEINEEEAAIVHMIFEDYIGGMGVSRIAKKLNAMGIRIAGKNAG